jgi:hypothetical protein
MFEKIRSCQPEYPKTLENIPKDLLSKIFIYDPNLRYNLQDIREHKFFKGINWAIAMSRDLNPPFYPTLDGHGDTAYFKEAMVKAERKLLNSPGTRKKIQPLGDFRMKKLKEAFEGF